MIPGAGSPDKITLQEVTITHKDGTTEEVYVQSQPKKDGFAWREHIPIIYATVGTIVLLLTGYVTYLQIKKSK